MNRNVYIVLSIIAIFMVVLSLLLDHLWPELNYNIANTIRLIALILLLIVNVVNVKKLRRK